MRAVCPNDPGDDSQGGAHREFITTAHICQDWKVDAEGHFLEAVASGEQVTHYPSPHNIWSCATCGASAVITR